MSHPYTRTALPQMSLREALSLGPDNVTPSPQLDYTETRASKYRNSRVFAAASEFLKSTVRRRSTSLQKKGDSHLPSKTAPPRPKRPPPEQCPPDQPFFALSRAQVFPNAPPLISNPFNFVHHKNAPIWASTCLPPNLSMPAHRPRPQVPSNLHYELAYNRLTSCLDDIEEEKGVFVNEPDDTVMFNNLDRTCRGRAEQAEKLKPLHRDTHILDTRESFSTLTSTTSKLDLKPSPLRLVKNEQGEQLPLIPTRSKLGSTIHGVGPASLISTETSNVLAAPSEHSSCETISVYSVDSKGLPTEPLVTPPSSPPELLQYRRGQSSATIEDASICAENLRSELGIIDDIYDMYTDSDKHFKHEAEVNLSADATVRPQALARQGTEKLSRAQIRLRKERARQNAIERLEAPQTTMEVLRTEFGQLFGNAFHLQGYKSQSSRSSVDSPSTPIRSDHDLVEREETSSTSSMIDNESLSTASSSSTKKAAGSDSSSTYIAHKAIVQDMNSIHPDVNPSQASLRASHSGCSRQSLAALRNQLNALMEDYTGPHDALEEKISHREGSISPSPSTSTSGSSLTPTNLQKIEIEWQGKRYPVLIGDHGRIWEGPCIDPYCKEHGGPRKELAFGQF